jgi:ABC-type glycerol-3-phosphate transport system permease component
MTEPRPNKLILVFQLIWMAFDRRVTKGDPEARIALLWAAAAIVLLPVYIVLLRVRNAMIRGYLVMMRYRF